MQQFKSTLRSIGNNRLFSLLNILGLAVGLASGILVLLWVHDEYSYNSFHRNLAQIHLILQHQTRGGQVYTFEATPGPLAAALRAEIPEVARAARYSWQDNFLLYANDKSSYEKGYYAEPEFLNILTFPALLGDPVSALREADNIVISEKTAKKYFGNENPLGKNLRINNQLDLKVGAVIQDVPTNSTHLFDVLLPFRIYEQRNQSWVNSSWGDFSMPTVIELQKKSNLEAVNAKLSTFIQEKNPGSETQVFAYPLADWRLKGRFVEGKQNGGRIDMVRMLSLIGVFVLLIACINFMNLSTARAERRAREVGVRKAIGASRRNLIGQFLGEAVLMSCFALILGAGMARLALPYFNLVFNKTLSLNASNMSIWASILGLGLLSGLLAGSYPAFYLSRFQPVRVLRGQVYTPGKHWGGASVFRRVLVTFQFVISIFLIVASLVFSSQIRHIQERPIGYEPECLIQLPARGDMQRKFDPLKTDLLQIPGVSSVSASNDNMIRFGSNTSGIQWPGKTDDQDFLITQTMVHYDWVRTMGIKLAEGRDFSPEFGGDTLACILNQTAVKKMGLKEPVAGSVIRHDTTRVIIGVIEDFLFNNITAKPGPMIAYLDKGPLPNFFVRMRNDAQWKQNIAQIEKVVKKHNPNYPFEFKFTSEAYKEHFKEAKIAVNLSNFFGGMAIFISCLGLFGLSAFVAERRKKEIGVRKVLGASAQNIWLYLSKDFLLPVLWAFILAAPLSWWVFEALLSRIEYRISLQWWMFAFAGLTAAIVALGTVSLQGIRAALLNPVKSLRNE